MALSTREGTIGDDTLSPINIRTCYLIQYVEQLNRLSIMEQLRAELFNFGTFRFV